MKELDYDKFANTVLFLLERCKRSPGLIALVKLVWYVDYWHYRHYLRSVTGGRYIALPMGPAPEQYDDLFARMCSDGILEMSKVPVYGRPKPKTRYHALKQPNMDSFRDTERLVLRHVVERLGHLSGEELVQKTHNEGPWALVWDENEPSAKPIPQSLWRWSDNLPREEDLKLAQEYVQRPEVQGALRKLQRAPQKQAAAV